jgi:hypothetical protein
MAIANTDYRRQVTLTSATQVISTNFEFEDATDLKVYNRDSSYVETLLTEDVNYAVSGGNGATGTITMIGATVGDVVTLELDPPETQTVDYEYMSSFPSEATETGMDKLVNLVKNVKATMDRCIKFPRSITSLSSKETEATNPDSLSSTERRLLEVGADGLKSDRSFSDFAIATDGFETVVANQSAMKGVDYSSLSTGSTVLLQGHSSRGDGGGGLFWVDKTDTSSSDDGGTLIVATDGTRLKRLFSGAVNAKWFGATGDGSTDDQGAIQDAIDSSEANNFTLVFSGGTYSVTDELVIDQNLIIRFETDAKIVSTPDNDKNIFSIQGGVVTIYDADLDHNHSMDAGAPHSAPIQVEGGDYITLVNPKITGADYGAVTVNLTTSDVKNLEIINPYFTDNYGGLFVRDDLGSYSISRIALKGGLIRECETEAIDLNSNVVGFYLDGTKIQRPYTSADLATSGNPFNVEALDLESVQDCIINNILLDCADEDGNNAKCPTGIRMKGTGGSRLQVNGGVIRNCLSPGIGTIHDTTPGNWTLTGSVSVSGDHLDWSGTGDAEVAVSGQANMVYIVKFTVENMTTGSLEATYRGGSKTVTENGDYILLVEGSGDDVLKFDGTSGFDGEIDVVNEVYMYEYWGAALQIGRTANVSIHGVTIEGCQDGIGVVSVGGGIWNSFPFGTTPLSNIPTPELLNGKTISLMQSFPTTTLVARGKSRILNS